MNFEDKEIYFPLPEFILTMAIQSLAVFCGSKNGNNPVFAQHAEQLGKLLAENNVKLIYGGGSAGLMGTIADSCNGKWRKGNGIIPKFCWNGKYSIDGITELIIADDMHDRKKTIYSVVMQH